MCHFCSIFETFFQNNPKKTGKDRPKSEFVFGLRAVPVLFLLCSSNSEHFTTGQKNDIMGCKMINWVFCREVMV